LGPIPIRAYALCIIAGILVALWLTQRRWKALGGNADDVIVSGSRSRFTHPTCGDGCVRRAGHDRQPCRCVCST
jgi:hypothetical protein